jgi:hypothetical protein
MFTLDTALILALAYVFLCAVSSAVTRLLLMQIGYNTTDEYVNAVCIRRTFAWACWLLGIQRQLFKI